MLSPSPIFKPKSVCEPFPWCVSTPWEWSSTSQVCTSDPAFSVCGVVTLQLYFLLYGPLSVASGAVQSCGYYHSYTSNYVSGSQAGGHPPSYHSFSSLLLISPHFSSVLLITSHYSSFLIISPHFSTPTPTSPNKSPSAACTPRQPGTPSHLLTLLSQ